MMDEILVFENGTIIERGTQGELLEKGGLYHRMYSLQRRIIDEN
jgi:ATP-binding cassette subfamily B protein